MPGRGCRRPASRNLGLEKMVKVTKKELPKHMKVFFREAPRPVPAVESPDPKPEVFEDAEEPDEDLEAYAPPSSPSTPRRLWNLVGRSTPSFAGHAERIKRHWWDDKEGSLGDRIKKQEARCRRLKEIEAHVDSELRGARQEEAHAEKRFEEAQARKTKISEGVGEELRRLEERKSALHAAAEQRMEVLKPRFHEVRAALNAARLAVKEKERRVEKVRHAFAQCRHDIETIALEHRAHASHAAALSAAHEAGRASEKAKRRAGIF